MQYQSHMTTDPAALVRSRVRHRTGAAAILAVAGGHAPSDFGLRVSEATANWILFGLGPGPSALLGSTAASPAKIPNPERWRFADPKIFATGATGPDAVLVDAEHGGLGQAEAKGVGTPEHFAHSGGCPAGLHRYPVGQAVAYRDACWVREGDRPAFREGPRIWHR